MRPSDPSPSGSGSPAPGVQRRARTAPNRPTDVSSFPTTSTHASSTSDFSSSPSFTPATGGVTFRTIRRQLRLFLPLALTTTLLTVLPAVMPKSPRPFEDMTSVLPATANWTTIVAGGQSPPAPPPHPLNHPSTTNPHHLLDSVDLFRFYEKLRDIPINAENVKPCPSSVLRSHYTFLHNASTTTATSTTTVKPCRRTVLVIDPRMGDPTSFPTHSLYFSLESVALYLGTADTCVALVTTPCQSMNSTRDLVYARSFPLFRRLMDVGRVRMTFLNPNDYPRLIGQCGAIANPTAVLMHQRFWSDHFVTFGTDKDEHPDPDPDQILVLQDDAVLCRPPMSMDDWDTDWAYAGAPWPPLPTDHVPWPPKGRCHEIPSKYRDWIIRPSSQQRSRVVRPSSNVRGRQEEEEAGASANKTATPPSSSLPDSIYVDCRYSVLGNGGFSLRRRSWMQRVISTCPNLSDSGIRKDVVLSSSSSSHDCVSDEPSEDLYFSTLLHAMKAPLPTPRQAANFGVETLFAEDVVLPPESEDHDTDLPGLGSIPQLPHIVVGNRTLTIPVGFHKPWWYIPRDVLLSPQLAEACPFLPLVMDPAQIKW